MEEGGLKVVHSPGQRALSGWTCLRWLVVWIASLLAVKYFVVPMVRRLAETEIMAFEAWCCAAVAQVFGLEVTLSGNIVYTSRFAMQVWFPCTGIDYMLYLVTLALLLPKKMSWYGRIAGALLLPALFYLLLVVRLVVLLIAGHVDSQMFPWLHEGWNTGFILVFCLLWFGFLFFHYGRTWKPGRSTEKNPSSQNVYRKEEQAAS